MFSTNKQKDSEIMNKDKISSMLSLQFQMNDRVNPHWLDAGYPFLLAAVIEAAEAIEHHGWKWWKAQRKDLAQVQMELVDIWHFTLSAALVLANGDIKTAANMLQSQSGGDGAIKFDGAVYQIEYMDTVAKLELLIGLSVSRRIDLRLFHSLLADCEMSFDDLYRQYIGKNVLNFFRQDNGYKEGTYIKEWKGREDNEHLADILSELDSGSQDFRTQIYVRLEERYRETT